MNTVFLDYINWLAVTCAALASFILGAIWYSKILFARKWMAYAKLDMNSPDGKKGIGVIMGASVILVFITALGIAVLQSKPGIRGWRSGLKLRIITGLCFGAMSISVSYLYEKRPFGLHLIKGGYILIGNIIAAMIICCWL